MTISGLLATHGISRRELARLGGPARMTLRRWERGEATPRGDAIRALARALDVPVPVAAEAAAVTVERARRDAARAVQR